MENVMCLSEEQEEQRELFRSELELLCEKHQVRVSEEIEGVDGVEYCWFVGPSSENGSQWSVPIDETITSWIFK